MRAVRVHRHGGPEVLRVEEVALPEPGPGAVRIRVEAAGINFIDVYHRTGLYPASPPFTPGMEAAGTVDAVGPGVADVRPGDRVACAMVPGAYAEYLVAPADRCVPVPATLSAEQAAASLLQGMTAHYLARDTFPLREGHAALVHAAAGGTGLLLVQFAKRAGATVWGTVSTPEKAERAREAGADRVVLYAREDVVAAVREGTGGRGVDVVYDSVGRATFEQSLDCLRPRGMLVLYGQSSGKVPPVDLWVLQQKGSLYVTRPSLAHYTATRDELVHRAGAVFDAVARGELRVRIHRRYGLEEAAEAHADLEARRTTGKLLLVP